MTKKTNLKYVNPLKGKTSQSANALF